MSVEERKRRMLHRRVVEATTGGLTRSEAFYVIGEELGVRAGHVAAAFWRVQRESGRPAPALPAPDGREQQLELGGNA